MSGCAYCGKPFPKDRRRWTELQQTTSEHPAAWACPKCCKVHDKEVKRRTGKQACIGCGAMTVLRANGNESMCRKCQGGAIPDREFHSVMLADNKDFENHEVHGTDHGIRLLHIKHQVVELPPGMTVQHAMEALTNGCCGD